MDEPIRRSKTENAPIAHTGSSNLPESMREFPVEEFDMSLQEAVEAGKVSTLPITETHSITPESKKRRKGLVIGIGGGAVAVAASVALALGLNLPKDDSSETVNLPPAPDPAATSEVNPSIPGDSSEVETAPIGSLEINSNTSPEKVSETAISRIDKWINAGKTPELQTEWLMAFAEGKVETNTEFLEPIAEKNATEYANALFVKGWENNPDLIKWVELFKQKNIAVLELWLITSDSNNPKDISPFEYSTSISLSSVTEKTDTSITTTVNFTEETNSNENRAIELNEDVANINGNAVTNTSTFVNEGNSWKISVFDIKSQ